MPEYQTSAAVRVAIQEEAVRGTKATDSSGSAKQLRIFQSPGIDPERTAIESEENRADGVRAMGRMGSWKPTASYNGPVTVGGAMDDVFRAIMRAAWTASAAITNTQMTSITTTSNTIIAFAGSWLTQGVRVGDVVRLTGHATAANNDKNLRVIGVTTSTLTVAGTGTTAATPLTADAVADSSFTLTVLKHLVTGATPLSITHTIDQNATVIDQSLVGVGFRVTGLRISAQPDQPVTYTLTYAGMGVEVLTTAQSPYFTDPTVTTGLFLALNNAVLRYNGADIANFTGFDLNFELPSDTMAVGGSDTSPDVFPSTLRVSGSITMLRSSLANVTLQAAETEFELHMLLEEPVALPRPCLGLFLGRVKVRKANADAGGGTGPLVETVDLMVGPRDAATGYDASVATISSSAA